jgi:hypothetical protein
VVTHTKLGTLYEEPCIVYFKVRQGVLPQAGLCIVYFTMTQVVLQCETRITAFDPPGDEPSGMLHFMLCSNL